MISVLYEVLCHYQQLALSTPPDDIGTYEVTRNKYGKSITAIKYEVKMD
ncbi:hypothetical protein ACMGD3_10925 [Lysinibacillus sphaericus]